MGFILYLILQFVYNPEKLTPELQAYLGGLRDNEKIGVMIIMKRQYPYKELENLSVHEKARIYKQIAWTNKHLLVEYLKQFPDKVDSLQQFWIFNGIFLMTTKEVIEAICQREDVLLVSHISQIDLPPIIEGEPIACDGIEWNIQKVMADSCWNAGYTGDSIIIGHIDSGVDTTHPALRGGKLIKWRDFVDNSPIPYDDFGHGTHTFGSLCGGDGLGPFSEDIGVAPGAKIIAAKIFGSTPGVDLLALQWMVDLKVDSGYNIRSVLNPWGVNTTLYYWEICNTLKSLEILPVFSIGNNGPGASTTGSPGNYPLCIGIGATNSNDSIAIFSSRGPAPDSEPFNNPAYWYRTDWNLIKPDIVAPGLYIRSAWIYNNYAICSGTSMSAPHVAGAIAILCQANPTLTVTELYNLILENADQPSQGAPYPNNNYGWGRLNVWKALKLITGIDENSKLLIAQPMLEVYPNPFQNHLNIKFQIPIRNPQSEISLKIYDATGRLVKSFNHLIIQPFSAEGGSASGGNQVVWSGDDDLGRAVPPGVYFIRLEAADFKRVEKIILIK